MWRQKTFGLREVHPEISVGWASRYESGYKEKGMEYGVESSPWTGDGLSWCRGLSEIT